ncbi:UNVERIFIED_CONTAM: hypothetical protein Sindi_0440600 [Sesamum indicum]
MASSKTLIRYAGHQVLSGNLQSSLVIAKSCLIPGRPCIFSSSEGFLYPSAQRTLCTSLVMEPLKRMAPQE